ncbi:hypothetical protein ACFL2A_04660 [Thermodesulfobacteriota bacterium]
MKCPKCESISFDNSTICKKCGYSFVSGERGKKDSFFSKLFGGSSKKDIKDDKAKVAPPTLDYEDSTVAQEVLESADESEVISAEPLAEAEPAIVPEAEPASETESFETEDEHLDIQFDSLFSDDNGEKESSGDTIKITATDSRSSDAGEGSSDESEYNFSDPFSEVIIPSANDADELFNENNHIDNFIKPDQEVTYGDFPAKEDASDNADEMDEMSMEDDDVISEEKKEGTEFYEPEKTSEDAEADEFLSQFNSDSDLLSDDEDES